MSFERSGARDYAEPQLPREPNDNSATMLAAVGVIALIVGVFLWWTVISSLGDSAESLFDEVAASPGATEAPAISVTEEILDCADFGPQRALSEEREALYQAQCVSPTPEASATSAPDTRLNRESCEEIRGTDYRSPGERTWFLANCVTQ